MGKLDDDSDPEVQPRTLRLELVAHPYAWPGGYPRFAITDDGGALCKNCCAAEDDSIDNAYSSDGWYITALDVNWEDTTLTCDHCSVAIESTYGEVDTPIPIQVSELGALL